MKLTRKRIIALCLKELLSPHAFPVFPNASTPNNIGSTLIPTHLYQRQKMQLYDRFSYFWL